MEINTRGLTELGYKIFLDRYALKDATRESLEVGTRVLAKIDGKKELATVVSIDDQSITIRTAYNQFIEVSRVEHIVEMGKGLMQVSKDDLDVPLELDPQDMWERVAKAVAEVELGDVSDKVMELYKQVYEDFTWLLEDWKFVPGGRTLAAAGASGNLTYYNCFVIPSPKDSKQGIFETAHIMSQLMSKGGGVGINISTLRPRYAYTQSTNGRSSGAVSWGEIYSFVTGLIEQGGARRGALMLILDDWHPDLLEFIKVKQNMNRVLNANISVGISEAFMLAVENDENWTFRFPDTTYHTYDEEWDGDILLWIGDDKPTKKYQTIKARQLWDMIVESAWTCAEPGLWFKGRSDKLSNSWYYAPLISTNPCGEQALPEWGCCNLGAINLSKFVGSEGIIKLAELERAVRVAVHFLDNVIDSTNYVLPEIEAQQKSERRIGLGTMGLAEMLIKMEVRYGGDESLKIIDSLYKNIANWAYDESINLALNKGPFPKFDNRKFASSNFIKILDKGMQDSIFTHGIRNVTLLTQAPTGTTGTMVNTSTGIEPFYFWEFERKGGLGSHMERVAVYDEWCNNAKQGTPLPDYFVTAQDLTPEEHIRVQATIQKWIDSSISKTCNVPEHYTKEQVGELYKLMYEMGCKGGTVYRDKSRNQQVLNLKQEDSNPKWRHRPQCLNGVTYRKDTPVGTLYVTINSRQDGPFEVFLNIGKAGSELAAQAEAFGRLMSYILRLPSIVTPESRMADVVGQLKNIGSGRSLGFGPNRVSSLADAIAQVFTEYAGIEEQSLKGLPEGDIDNGNFSVVGDICPNCGNATFYRIEGCKKCFNCSYSEC